MSILSEAIEIEKEIKKFLKEEKVLRMSSTVFLTSLFAFGGVEILFYYSILLPMMNIIKGVLIWTMVFTSSFIAASLLINYSERLLKERQSKIAKQKTEQEAQEKNKLLEEEITDLLSSLSGAEKSILKLVANGNSCGVWVAENDVRVLTLLHKGILEKLSDTRIWADWYGAYDNRAYCVPVIIAQKFQKAIIDNLCKRTR